MNVNDLGVFISQYGFPIVACGVLFWQNTQQAKRHEEESKRWADALAANTSVLTELKLTLQGMRQ